MGFISDAFEAVGDVVGSVVDAVVDVVDSIPIVGDFADDVLGLDPNGGGIVPIVKGIATGVVLSPIGGFAGSFLNSSLSLGLGAAGQAALGGATIGAATGGVQGAVYGATGGYIGSVVGQTLSNGQITTIFDDGSQLVTDASGNVLSGVDIDGASFSVTNGVAHYADGSTLGGIPDTTFDNPGNYTDASGQFHDVEGLYGQAGDVYDSNGVNLTAESRLSGSGFTGPTQTGGNYMDASGYFHDVTGEFGQAGDVYAPNGTNITAEARLAGSGQTFGPAAPSTTTNFTDSQGLFHDVEGRFGQAGDVYDTNNNNLNLTEQLRADQQAQLQSTSQNTVPTTTVPTTSDLSQPAPGVSPVTAAPVVPDITTTADYQSALGRAQRLFDLSDGTRTNESLREVLRAYGYNEDVIAAASDAVAPPTDWSNVDNIDINGVGTNPADSMNTVPTTTIPPTSDLSQPATGVNTGITPVEPTPINTTISSPTTTTVTYDDGSTMTYNTETGMPISGADTTGATFTVNPTTGVATYDATGSGLGGTPNTNFGGSLANPTDVQNLLDYNAGLPPVVDNSRPYDETTLGPLNDGGIINLGGTNIPDVVTGIVAGGVLVPPIINALNPPTTPTSPYAGQTFTPASPGSQWSGKLVNANMIPSYVGRAASVPFYNTTSPVQSQYYWGVHPYVPLGGDLAQYNNIPEAPAQPWGLQRGFFEGAQPNYQPVVYGQNMNPVNPGSTIG